MVRPSVSHIGRKARASAIWPALALLVPLALATQPASALDIVNENPEAAKIMIEKWVTILSPGRGARFRPYDEPTLIKVEQSHIRLECEAGPEDSVRLAENNCYVNGELAGEGRFRM